MKTVPYFLSENIEPEEYEDYECFMCGIIESEEDFKYPDDEDAGIVFSSGSALAPETYLCHRCRRIFYEKQ